MTIWRINVTVTYYTTPYWAQESTMGFNLFEATSNAWGTLDQMAAIVGSVGGGGGSLSAGLSWYETSFYTASLSNIFVTFSGNFNGASTGEPATSIFVAEPPTGCVPDEKAYEYGPPWIALNALSSGNKLSGDLRIINGYDSQAGTSHPWIAGNWSLCLI